MAGPIYTTSALTRRWAPTVPALRRANTDDRSAAIRVSGDINRPPAMIDRQSVVALQRTLGNAAVCRLLQRQRTSQATTPLIQRYPVDVPREADCDTLINWLDTKNPYAGDGNWAQTTCKYNVTKGRPIVSPYEVDGVTYFRVRLNNPRVSFRTQAGRPATKCSVDMPRWRPRNRAMREAWQAAWDRLRRHEAEHEEIGRTHREIIEEFLRDLDIYTDATDRDDAIAQADEAINKDLARLEGEHQQAQDAIDPFRPPFDCPDDETEEATEASAAGSLGDVFGGLAAWFGGEDKSKSSAALSDQGSVGKSTTKDSSAELVAANAEKSSDDDGSLSDWFSSKDDKDEKDGGSWWG
ncbi:MAG: DUF922 domain-containing protein [Thermomicrobiales bacterium]